MRFFSLSFSFLNGVQLGDSYDDYMKRDREVLVSSFGPETTGTTSMADDGRPGEVGRGVTI